jgi:hypothetical protein
LNHTVFLVMPALVAGIHVLFAANDKPRRGRPGTGSVSAMAAWEKVRHLLDLLTGDARDKAARATGKKVRTLAKAEQVITAARADPLRFGDLAQRLNEHGVRVDGVHRELKQRTSVRRTRPEPSDRGEISDLKALAPAGRRFKVIYADPQWAFKVYSGRGKARRRRSPI